MRKLHIKIGNGSALLDGETAPPRAHAPVEVRRPAAGPVRPRRELVDDFADDADTEAFLRASGRNRRIRRGLIPQTKTGRIAAGVGALLCVLGACGGSILAARYLTTSREFRIPSSRAIEVDGNSHLTRAQMLSVFGEDVDGNLFRVPLEQRRAQLEQMPWVEHATLMRLLPNRIRVHVTERVPVAFARQGSNIGLVDANGVLLDIPPDVPGTSAYTFPVITGLKADQEPAARAERMRLYNAFLKDLDSDGKGTSALLSEVDVSDPEDIKALIPDHNVEVLVHFGTENFLARYRRFEEHIAEWRSQYARLSSVDMRYERQVVLQMPPKDSTVTGSAPEDRPLPNPAGVHAAAEVSAKAGQLHSDNNSPMYAETKVSHPTSISPATGSKRVPALAKATASATEAKQVAMRKRVEAIRAWMEKREKARATAR